MRIYKTVFFWFGGVLSETIPELTLGVLRPGAKGHEALKIRQQIRELAEGLSLGKLAPTAYCEQAVALCSSEISVVDLKRRIIASTALRQPIAELIGQIPETYERWLVVDYPREWYQELSAQGQLKTLFSENRMAFTSALELISMVPDIFYRLPQKAGRPIEDCIVIDPLSARAVAAMKHGLAAIIYVYPERLKLELALQAIWQTEADVMHPAASERIKFS
jgi:hypothetical protein